MKIAGVNIPPKSRTKLNLDVGKLFDRTPLKIPVEVIRGAKEGPTLFITAAVHGDEINGVEIIRTLMGKKILSKIAGTLITVPIVNVYGFNMESRYFPDRRDLNRSFPGNSKGSLASRVAHIIMKEIVKKSTYGLDLHSGSDSRFNFPQIRGDLKDETTKSLALAFGAPVIIPSDIRDGSLRASAKKNKTPTLVYEAGEAHRFDDKSISIGVKGCLNVMRAISMLPAQEKKVSKKEIFIASNTEWVRAPEGGCLRFHVKSGQSVRKGQKIAQISDPYSHEGKEIFSPLEGIVIGILQSPLVNQGDAIFHIANFSPLSSVHKKISTLYEDLD